MHKYSLYTLLLFLTALPSVAPAQNENPGQMVQQDHQLAFWNMRTYGKSGYYELFSPSEENANVGVWQNNGPNSPAQQIVTVDGLLGFAVPANRPYVVGIFVAQPLYDNSPGEIWEDFGKKFHGPQALPLSANPPGWNSINANQFTHMPDQDMWQMVGGDPFTLGNWVGTFPGLSPVNGESPWGFATPLGPGRFFDQAQPFLPSLPPNVGPGGGNLVGMNLVVQIGVLDANSSTPGAARFSLTNAIGIQAMAGPPIKLNGSSGGNWGPPLSRIDFQVTNPNNDMKVAVPLSTGGTAILPVKVDNGSQVSFRLPLRAASGQVNFTTSYGPVGHIRQPMAVVTHGPVQDLTVVGAPNWTIETSANGRIILGTSVIGNIGAIANNTLTVPVPPAITNYDLEIRVYPLNRVSFYAGIGTTVPVSLGIGPVGALPSSAFVPPNINLLGDNTVVLEQCFDNVTGPVDLTLTTSAPQGFDFLAVVRAIKRP